MNRKVKRIVALVLALAIMSTACGNLAFASEEPGPYSVETVMQDYHDALQRILISESASTTRSASNELAELRKTTVAKFNALGYEAYDVNPGTFEDVEKALNTDLVDAGLDPASSYIVTIGDSGVYDGISTRERVSDSFNYTYKGKTYKLRWMTILGSEMSAFQKATTVNLLSKGHTREIIKNALDMTVEAFASAASASYPVVTIATTVASLCGLKLSDFALAQSSKTKMDLNIGSAWTRRFTQVYDSRDKGWFNGCYVEELKQEMEIYSYYCHSDTNAYGGEISNIREGTTQSTKYKDMTWRKDNAVVGFLEYYTIKNRAGDSTFEYGGHKVTHTENF